METRSFFFYSLDDLLKVRSIKSESPANRVLKMRDMRVFLDMLKGMLQLDAAQRHTPGQCLSSLETMAAFRNSNPGSNSVNAGGSSQTSPPSKPQPSQKNRPASPACSSGSFDQSQSTINP
ncbi:homeodomain-interacting protein kinase 2-like [Xyrichtys novacula]|uniref:Homeodomain-interacting protein kinase 2-like n=1 Tax=Xyrichtys novacula TaxID=13765 RepID=A0AAV1FLQ7_XYRNO|nr:homeodomain-interacting protein kinase 2-like [Xyrichtys novacula]